MRELFILGTAACALVACTADISGVGGVAGSSTSHTPPGSVSGGGAGGSPVTAPGPTDSSTPADPNAAGPMPLRRLTRAEYNNTVRDLLNDTTHPADDFPPDEQGEALFPVAPWVDSLLASRLSDAAGALAAKADLAKLLPCKPPAVEEAACVGQFINTLGARAFRRPVLPGELERLQALFQAGRSSGELDFEGGVRFVLEAMLQSAAFLYHWELGPQAAQVDGQWVRLGPYEVASRLSYFLWGSMPDDALLAAAAADKLGTDAEVVEQARRLLADPKARANIAGFFQQWLGLDQMPSRSKDAATYPEFNDALKAAMSSEIDQLISSVTFDGDGRLGSLLTGTTASLSGPLAAVYGMSGVNGGAAQSVQLNPAERSGLLTRAGFQALFGGPTGSNPVKRGVEIYRRVLCGTIPAPPANVPPPKEASEGGTTRSRFAEHSQNACATGCHSLFDGLGYAFEHYDGIGRFRSLDNGQPVDSSGTLVLDGQQVSFADGIQLSALLAQSSDVERCFASRAASYGLGRAVVEADRFSTESAVASYVVAGAGMRDLLATLAASRTFRYRSPAAGEVLQ